MKTIVIDGAIGWDISARDIRKELKDSKDIRVEINSPGGFVSDGFEIYNMLKNHSKKYDVNTHIMGIAASAASFIHMAGNKRTAEKNSMYFIHNARSIAVGDQNTMRKMADHLEKVSDMIADIYIENTDMNRDEVIKMMNEETFFYGNEIQNAGFAEEIFGNDTEEKKETALLKCQMMIENTNKLFNELEETENDLQRAVAYYKKDGEPINFEDVMNPYPNEHAARVRDPGDFQKDSFRRKKLPKSEGGKGGVSIILGKLNGKDTMTEQAYRFPKDLYTVAEAKAWLKKNNVKYILFEPASDGEDNNEIISDDIPDDNIINLEGIMDFHEFLKTNPDAQAEFDSALKSARDEEREKVQKNAVAILKLEKATLSKPAIEALEKNSTVEEYAVKKLEAEIEAREKTEPIKLFDSLLAPQTPNDQVKNVIDEKPKTRTDEDCKNMAKSFLGGM